MSSIEEKEKKNNSCFLKIEMIFGAVLAHSKKKCRYGELKTVSPGKLEELNP